MSENPLYEQNILPLIKQLSESGLPFLLVVQTSDADFRLSAHIPPSANKELKQCYEWWKPQLDGLDQEG